MGYRGSASIAIVTLMLMSGIVVLTPSGEGISWTPGPLTKNDNVVYNIDNSSYYSGNYPGGGGAIMVAGLMVGGDLIVKVHHIWKAGDLVVVVANNQVGGNLDVLVDENPFLYDLRLAVSSNLVGEDIQISASFNAVSNLHFGIWENEACNDITARARLNSIDFLLSASVQDNKAVSNMVVDISGNHHPANWPELFNDMKIEARSNHAVRYDLRFYINGNRLAEKAIANIWINISYNGAGRDLWVRVIDNRAIFGIIRVNVIDNASDNYTDIMIHANAAFKIFVTVMRNYGCIRVNVIIQFDAIATTASNVRRCMQDTAPDTDGDGLTDLFEMMVGTDMNDRDTDDDGLADGWNDTNRNMRWDIGERFGELGDPRAELKYDGSVMFLVESTNQEPSPLCTDIYVEVDYLKGVKKLPKGTMKMLENKFAKHRIKLHIDDGWAVNAGGGQKMKHNCEKREGVYFLFMGVIIGERNDFYDFKGDPNYFDPLREDLFHYAIIANYVAYENSTGHLLWKKTTHGLGERPGDDFVLARKAIADWVKETYIKKANQAMSLEFAKTFMHELGHNLNLLDLKPLSDEYLTVMYRYSSAIKPLDFKQPSEWNVIQPRRVLEPYD